MTTLTEISDLLDKAPGPDRGLDVRIALATAHPGYAVLDPDCGVIVEPRPEGYVEYSAFRHVITVDQYTRSIDAALGLVERLLPGWTWNLGSENPHHSSPSPWCCLAPPGVDWDEVGVVQGDAPTVPFAILKALIVALIEKEKQG